MAKKAVLCLLLGFEAAGFHAVAGELHVTPASRVVLAGVEEEPAALLVVVFATAAIAAEITVFCPGALRPAMSELVPEFERASAHKVAIQYGTAGALADRIQKGETADVAILTPPQIENFAKQGVVTGDSKNNVGKIGIGVAVSKGAAKPDVGSVESFKRSMLAANRRSL